MVALKGVTATLAGGLLVLGVAAGLTIDDVEVARAEQPVLEANDMPYVAPVEAEPVGPVIVETAVPADDVATPDEESYIPEEDTAADDYAGYCAPESYDSSDFRTMGVVYDGGTRYTWYSQNVLPGGGLDISGRHVDGNGYVRDGDGYIVVASSDHERGTVLETPFGTAVVYDTGCPSGTVDVYTNF